MLKMLSNGIVDVKSKKPHVHFAHGYLVDYDIFMLLKKTKNTNQHANPPVSTKIT
jgi:hypothetical protein